MTGLKVLYGPHYAVVSHVRSESLSALKIIVSLIEQTLV
jgi:hypothetical protein